MNETAKLGCGYDNIQSFPHNPRLAMAYVPYQQDPASIYSPEKGFSAGTMFPCLDKPFMGAGGRGYAC